MHIVNLDKQINHTFNLNVQDNSEIKIINEQEKEKLQLILERWIKKIEDQKVDKSVDIVGKIIKKFKKRGSFHLLEERELFTTQINGSFEVNNVKLTEIVDEMDPQEFLVMPQVFLSFVPDEKEDFKQFEDYIHALMTLDDLSQLFFGLCEKCEVPGKQDEIREGIRAKTEKILFCYKAWSENQL